MSVPGQRSLSRRRRPAVGDDSGAGPGDGPVPVAAARPVRVAGSLCDDGLASRLLRVLLFLPAEHWVSGSTAPATAARLIRLLVWEERSTEVAAFLAPRPGGDASFEVESDEPPGDARSFGPDLAAGVREAVRVLKAGTPVRVFAVAGGVRRLVLRSSDGDRSVLEYVPPTPSSFEGPPDLLAEAAREWSALAFPPTVPLRPEPAPAPAPDVAAEVRRALGGLTVEVDRAAVTAAVTESLAGLHDGLQAALDTLTATMQTQVEAAVRSALAGATIGVDPAEIEAAVRRAVAGTGEATDQALEIRELTGLLRRLLDPPGRGAG